MLLWNWSGYPWTVKYWCQQRAGHMHSHVSTLSARLSEESEQRAHALTISQRQPSVQISVLSLRQLLILSINVRRDSIMRTMNKRRQCVEFSSVKMRNKYNNISVYNGHLRSRGLLNVRDSCLSHRPVVLKAVHVTMCISEYTLTQEMLKGATQTLRET